MANDDEYIESHPSRLRPGCAASPIFAPLVKVTRWKKIVTVFIVPLAVLWLAMGGIASAGSVDSLGAAQSLVASWSTMQLANEVVAVSINASNLGAMAPAATAGFGGLLLFGSTAPATTSSILHALQRESPNGLLVMTDEEGGGVMRLSNLVTSIPWAQTMGKNLTASAIETVGSRLGSQLHALGVNTDLAPVLDIDGSKVAPGPTNPDGLRSFGGAATVVGNDGVAFVNGLKSAGVLSVVKHFPGLGGASSNTDYGPAATLPFSVLLHGGLLPFANAIANGAQAVMLSNASTPGLSSLPASISPITISYLRQTMGFNGLIVTDSLSAGAISARHLSEPQAAVLAIEAGADLVLCGSPTSPAASLALASKVSTALQATVTSGVVPLATLQAAAAQVLWAQTQVGAS